MSVFWLIVGALTGFDVVLAVAWLTTRRANRRGTLAFDTPASRQALARVVLGELQKRRRRNSIQKRSKTW